jgi:hypothetical protein
VLELFFLMLPAAGASTRAARITVPLRSPVTVRGTGFHASERVTITVSAKSTHAKTVTANRLGNFRATFRGFPIGYCEAYSVRARGNRGSRALLKVIPECAPQGPPGTLSPSRNVLGDRGPLTIARTR